MVESGRLGEMSEWFKEHAWKACVGETPPWVRIPLSPLLTILGRILPPRFHHPLGNPQFTGQPRDPAGSCDRKNPKITQEEADRCVLLCQKSRKPQPTWAGG